MCAVKFYRARNGLWNGGNISEQGGVFRDGGGDAIGLQSW